MLPHYVVSVLLLNIYGTECGFFARASCYRDYHIVVIPCSPWMNLRGSKFYKPVQVCSSEMV
jgi:hypothetical protein